MSGRGQGAGWSVATLLAWLAGIGLQLQQAQLWPRGAHAAMAVAALLLLLIGGWVRGPGRAGASWRSVAAPAAALLLGFATTGWRAESRLDQRLDPRLEGLDLIVTGVVSGLPTLGDTGARLRLRVESAHRLDGAPVDLPPLLSLGWYPTAEDAALLLQLAPGQRWRLPLRLRQPHGLSNPHGFDTELWLFEQGLGATGSVRPARVAPAELLDAEAEFSLDGWRQQVRDRLFARIADRSAAGVLAALAIGDQAAILRGDWDVFRATGVAHLMSISGLHITMLAWLAAALARRGWSLSTRALLWLPAPMAARWIGLAAALGYSLLAGWGVPAQRTVWMLACVALLRTGSRAWPWPLVLGAAAMLVTLVDPWALTQAGFWLSFAAVALLMASDPAEPADHAQSASGGHGLAVRVRHGLRQGLRTQAIATLGLAPLSMVLFQQLSVVGFGANLVAVPLVTLLITPLALLGIVLPPLWDLAALLVAALGTLLGLAAAVPGAVLWLAAAPPWAQVAALAGGALSVAPLPWRARLAALPLVLPLLAAAPAPPPLGRFDLLAVDIGQGTAVLLRTRTHDLLYDTGPAYSPTSDAGQRVLLPLLRALGVRRLDLLVLSHRDTDHVGGAASLMQGLPVLQLASSLEPDHRLQRPGTTRCEAGQRWEWDGVQFEFLQPRAAAYGVETKSNALSCVLAVRGRRGSALLAGDIEAAQERALVEANPDALQADVLVVPHHGSKTSSTPAFIDAVAPRFAVMQAAYRSRFGHPAAEVVSRYAERGIAVLRSDRCGAWRWRSGAATGHCWRQAARRYWQHSLVDADPVDPAPDDPLEDE